MGVLESLHRGVNPWFRREPLVAAAVAASLFAGISLFMWFADMPGDAASVLFVIPIALLAVTFGLRGGLVGAVLGFGILFVVWFLKPGGHMPAFGWVVRGTAMFLTGVLLGGATDQIGRHEREALAEQKKRFDVEEENRRYEAATEISDSILQHLVATKWQVEQDRIPEALDTLTQTIERSQRMVGELLPRKICPRIEARRAEEPSRSESPERS